MFSAFNPSKCTHLEQWAADIAAPGEQSWTFCWSRDSNPQPWVTSGFKSNALSIRPRHKCDQNRIPKGRNRILVVKLKFCFRQSIPMRFFFFICEDRYDLAICQDLAR